MQFLPHEVGGTAAGWFILVACLTVHFGHPATCCLDVDCRGIISKPITVAPNGNVGDVDIKNAASKQAAAAAASASSKQGVSHAV